MVKAPTHARKRPPPGRPVAPLVVHGRAVSTTSLRSGGTSRTASTERTTGVSLSSSSASEGGKPAAKRLPRAQPQAYGGGNSGRQGPSGPLPGQSSQKTGRPAQNGGACRPTGGRSNRTTRPPRQQQQQQQQQQQEPKRKPPPTHLLTNARTSTPGEKIQRQQQQQRRSQQKRRQQQLQAVQENEAGDNNNDEFEALTWNPFQDEDGRTDNEYWSGGSTQAGVTAGNTVGATDSSDTTQQWSEAKQSSSATLQTISSIGTTSQSASAFSVEGGVHVPSGSNRNSVLVSSLRTGITGKRTRKLAGKLGSKLTAVGAKARGTSQMGDDNFYGAGEAGYSTAIRTITEEEASGQSPASTIAGTTTIVSVTQRVPQQTQQQQQQPRQGQQPSNPTPNTRDRSQLDNTTRAPSSRFIPTAFARLASVQTISAGTAMATVQAAPATAAVGSIAGAPPVVSARPVIARTTSLRPPAPVVVGGKVVVKGVALHRSLGGDLNAIDAIVQKYKSLRAAAGQRNGGRASVQSNSELAASIAELRACLPKLEALVNRAVLSRTADANTLERCLTLNDELRKILASLKGEGIKRKFRDRPTRSSQLPTAQAAREQQLFKKMREDSAGLVAPVAKTVPFTNTTSTNEKPLFRDDPFHDFPDPFASIPEDESVKDDYKKGSAGKFDDSRKAEADDDSSKSASDTSSISMLPVVSEDDQSGSLCSDSVDESAAAAAESSASGNNSEDRTGLSRLEDEVARLEKQLSGLDPLAKLAMDAVLDEDMSNMSGLSIMSDGEASTDAGFADMEREMMNQLVMGNDWMASEAVDDKPKISRVKFSQEVTVFEIPNRHQARAAMA